MERVSRKRGFDSARIHVHQALSSRRWSKWNKWHVRTRQQNPTLKPYLAREQLPPSRVRIPHLFEVDRPVASKMPDRVPAAVTQARQICRAGHRLTPVGLLAGKRIMAPSVQSTRVLGKDRTASALKATSVVAPQCALGSFYAPIVHRMYPTPAPGQRTNAARHCTAAEE